MMIIKQMLITNQVEAEVIALGHCTSSYYKTNIISLSFRVQKDDDWLTTDLAFKL